MPKKWYKTQYELELKHTEARPAELWCSPFPQGQAGVGLAKPNKVMSQGQEEPEEMGTRRAGDTP